MTSLCAHLFVVVLELLEGRWSESGTNDDIPVACYSSTCSTSTRVASVLDVYFAVIEGTKRTRAGTEVTVGRGDIRV